MTRSLAKARFERSIPAEWNAAKGQWEACKQFFAAQGLHPDEVYALTMATSELLENAVKYGDWHARPTEQIGLVIEAGGRAITVEVQSPVVDDPATLRRLDDRIQWIRGFQSPFEAYVERLKQLTSTSIREGESGLGLIRIAYEARCLLDFYVTPTGRLAMSASYQPGGLY